MCIDKLGMAADIVFEICRRHPELCPHYYRWSRTQYKATETVKYYKCQICGQEKTEVIPGDKRRMIFMGYDEPNRAT